MSNLFRYEKADETVLEEGFIIDPGVCEHEELSSVFARAAHHLGDSAGVVPQEGTDVVHPAGVDLPAIFARVVLGEFRGRHAQERVDATSEVDLSAAIQFRPVELTEPLLNSDATLGCFDDFGRTRRWQETRGGGGRARLFPTR